MSYNEGMRVGQGLASIGFGLASTFRQQGQEQIKAEKHDWEKEDRAKLQKADEIAAKIFDDTKNGKDPDLSQFTPEERLYGASRFAQLQKEQFSVSREGQEAERTKMVNSAARSTELAKKLLSADEMGDEKAVEELGGQLLLRSRLNDVANYEKLQDGTYNITMLDGSTKTVPKPSRREIVEAAKLALDPKAHIQRKAAMWKEVRDYNRVAMKPKTWVNEKGESIFVQENLAEYDPDTGAINHVNKYFETATGLTPIPPETVKAGGFAPVEKAENEAKVKKAQLGGELADTQRESLGQVDPATVIPNRAGSFTGKTIGGGFVSGDEVPATAIPAEKSKYNQVVTKNNEYAYSKEPGAESKEQVVYTGIKAPTKAGKSEEAKIQVRDAKTGKAQQMTIKQVRANLKEAKAILKSVKDDSGNTFVLPNLKQLQSASPEDKETVIAKIERLSTDTKQSQVVRTAANQVLNYLEALGVTQTAGQAIGGGSTPGTGGQKAPSWKDIREDLLRLKQGNRPPEPATLQ